MWLGLVFTFGVKDACRCVSDLMLLLMLSGQLLKRGRGMVGEKQTTWWMTLPALLTAPAGVVTAGHPEQDDGPSRGPGVERRWRVSS